MKWEIVCACGWDAARKLAADGYEPYAVDRDGHYFKRQVPEPEPPEHRHENCAICQAVRDLYPHQVCKPLDPQQVRADTLKEVAAWLRQQVGNVWTLEQFHAFQRGEMPK